MSEQDEYETPVFQEQNGMVFTHQIIDEFNKGKFCIQCSGCHGCR